MTLRFIGFKTCPSQDFDEWFCFALLFLTNKIEKNP